MLSPQKRLPGPARGGAPDARGVGLQAREGRRDPRGRQSRTQGANRTRRTRELEAARDALGASYAETVPEALDGLSGEERSRVYEMLRLEVTPNPEGYQVSGALCSSRPTGRRRFESTKRTELRFHALITEDGPQQTNWTRA